MSQNKNGEAETARPRMNNDDYTAVQINVGIARDDPTSYAQQHIDVQLDAVQSRTLKRVKDSLDTSDQRLKNGRHVSSSADAVRWLLEQIAQTAIRKSMP